MGSTYDDGVYRVEWGRTGRGFIELKNGLVHFSSAIPHAIRVMTGQTMREYIDGLTKMGGAVTVTAIDKPVQQKMFEH